MVLIALAIAFAGIGAMTLSSSDSASPAVDVVPSVAPVKAAPNSPGASARPTTPAPSASTAAATATPPAASAAVDRAAVPVRVFNNSTVSGLAAQTAGTLESRGWTVSETGNYSSGNVAKTTAFYSANSAQEKQAAQAIASELGISAEQRFSGIATASPGVIVIVTSP
ncbi:hypothetical protein GCM10023094_44990 [Rhodococcus olei]|uniref:LytR/CpsA/Psr regulator C-terminal domain-containing protein n=2 Tax=Rhodococcus olei TaxID=2161675 RepID=A0ABP8PJJ3_9NOCA